MKPKSAKDTSKQLSFISVLSARDREFLTTLINHRVVQRLRKIHQLGFTFFAFPGAMHSRFDHTISTLELIFSVIKNVGKVTPDIRRHLIAAAVLQDVGHGPFSNSLNSCFPSFNDDKASNVPIDIGRSIEIIKWMDIQDGHLKRLDLDFFKIRMLLCGISPWPDMPLVKALFDSELDIDRLAYLPQDAGNTGITIPDVNHVVKNILWKDGLGMATIDACSLSSAAQFVFSRAELYTFVYLNPIKLALEFLVAEFLDLYWNAKSEIKFRRPDTIEHFLNWTDSLVIRAIEQPISDRLHSRLNQVQEALISGRLQVGEIESLNGNSAGFAELDKRLKRFQQIVDPNLFIRVLSSDLLPKFRIYSPKSVMVKQKNSYAPLETSCPDLQSLKATEPIKHRPIIIFLCEGLTSIQTNLEKARLKLGNISRIKSINESVVR